MHRACLCGVWVKYIDLVPIIIGNVQRGAERRDLGVRRACLCVVWVKYIDLIASDKSSSCRYVPWGYTVPAYVLCGLQILTEFPLPTTAVPRAALRATKAILPHSSPGSSPPNPRAGMLSTPLSWAMSSTRSWWAMQVQQIPTDKTDSTARFRFLA